MQFRSTMEEIASSLKRLEAAPTDATLQTCKLATAREDRSVSQDALCSCPAR